MSGSLVEMTRHANLGSDVYTPSFHAGLCLQLDVLLSGLQHVDARCMSRHCEVLASSST